MFSAKFAEFPECVVRRVGDWPGVETTHRSDESVELRVGSTAIGFVHRTGVVDVAFDRLGLSTSLWVLARERTPATERPAEVVEAYGHTGLVGLKRAASLVCLGVSLLGADDDQMLYYLPPVLLTFVGSFFTVSNVRLLSG